MKIRFQAALCALAILVPAAAFGQKSYWLGVPEGDQLKFTVKIPASAVRLLLETKKAPGRGADTVPRYRKFEVTSGGSTFQIHSNEVAWYQNKVDEGELTWLVEAGMGAEWLNADANDPLYSDFAKGLKKLSPRAEDDWHTTTIFAVEGPKPPESLRLNRDGTFGKPNANSKAMTELADLGRLNKLGAVELERARAAFLAIANAARADANYRKANQCKKALNLPEGLGALVADPILDRMAQNQAEYCAKVKEPTHEQSNAKYADIGARMKVFGAEEIPAYEAAGGGSLEDCPRIWLRSETHYRPWWNLDNQVVTKVGFGVAKGSDGMWYFVAVLQ